MAGRRGGGRWLGARAVRWGGVVMTVALLSGCLLIHNPAMPRLYVGRAVSIPMTADGAEGPLTWSATGLPAGLAIDPASGVISGTPESAGTGSITASAVEAGSGRTVTASYPYESVAPAPFVRLPVPVPTIAQFNPAISDDGRFVAYLSGDQSLWPEGNPGQCCLATALWDRATGQTVRVSPHLIESVAYLAISGDGRFVAHPEFAGTFQTGPSYLYVWDRVTGASERVPDPDGNATNAGGYPSLSYDGRYVSYLWRRSGSSTMAGYLYDRLAHTTVRITPDAEYVAGVRLSGDGGTAVYGSAADGMVPGDGNGRYDVFRWDRATGTTVRLTDNQLGGVGIAQFGIPSISGDGSTVVYEIDDEVPYSRNLYLWDRASGTSRLISRDMSSRMTPALSADGATVVYRRSDVGYFLWERTTGATTRLANASSSDLEPVADLSRDGQHLVIEWAPEGRSVVETWDRLAVSPTP